MSALLDLLLGSYGEHVWISAPFFVDYGENIHIGHHVEINMNCVFLDCNRITIGNYSGIGPGVHIYTVFHPTNPAERRNENAAFWNSSTAPVVIGDDVWIGGRSVILPGVTVGNGTTISVQAASLRIRFLPVSWLSAIPAGSSGICEEFRV